MLIKMDKKCKKLKASRIVLFNSKYNTVIKESNEDTVPHYEERALGRLLLKSRLRAAKL